MGRRNLIAAAAAAIVLVAGIAAYRKRDRKREKFASGRAIAIFNDTKPLFDKYNGNLRYSEYKIAVSNADPVQFDDLKKLWAAGTFSPEAIESKL